MTEEQRELWRAAARCYQKAGKDEDACRCLEQAGQAADAAVLHERGGRWRQAGESHERAGQHAQAGRCYSRAGQWQRALAAYERAGDRVRAGWILADKLRMVGHGFDLVEGIDEGTEAAQVMAELVRARSLVGMRQPGEALRRLCRVLERLEVPSIVLPWCDRGEIVAMAVAVCEALARPDLAVRAQVGLARDYDEAAATWEVWSQRMLGMAWAYPVRESEAHALYRAGHSYVEPVLEMPMMWIPPGEFWMGAEDIYDKEKPVHRVRLSGYWLGKYVVTNRQYGKYLAASGADAPELWENAKYNQAEQPVVGVSWHDAVAFCHWLSAESGQRYELPSEAEWEYAARGPESRKYPWGEEEPDEERAYYGKGWNDAALPVGSKPKGRGLFGNEDQAGNVLEWCRDVWDEEAYQKRSSDVAENPETNTGRSTVRPLRGGAFNNDAGVLRAAYRGRYDADFGNHDLGFRVAARPPSRYGT